MDPVTLGGCQFFVFAIIGPSVVDAILTKIYMPYHQYWALFVNKYTKLYIYIYIYILLKYMVVIISLGGFMTDQYNLIMTDRYNFESARYLWLSYYII